MARADVVGLLEMFERAGLRVWIDGGWGVDALLGEQLRVHDDLDIVVDIRSLPAVQEALRRSGYAFQEGEAPLSFMAVDPAGRQVDVHPVAFDEHGNGVYQMTGGATWTYPAEGLVGAGSIGGKPVQCLTPSLQVLVHAGYELAEKDHEEIRVLVERFGVEPPPDYAWPHGR